MRERQGAGLRRLLRWVGWPRLGACALGVALLIAAMLVQRVYQHQMQDSYRRVERELTVVAQWQAQGVSAWREQRRVDGALLLDDTLLAQAVATWMSHPTDATRDVVQKRLRSLQERAHYIMVYLVDARGELLLSPQAPLRGKLPEPEWQAMQQAVAHAEPQLLAPRKAPVFAFPFTSVVVPLFQGAQAVGGVWLVSDVRTSLSPLLRASPLPYDTASTALVPGRGDGFVPWGPLSVAGGSRVSESPALPAGNGVVAQALRGGRGVLYGTDEQGREVMSAASAVPGADWVVVVQVQKADVLADVWWRELLSMFVPVALVVLLLAGAFMAWLHRTRCTEKQLRLELRRNRLWLETAQRSAAMGCFVFDPQTAVLSVSPMVREILGLKNAQNLTIRQWLRCVYPADRRLVLEQHRQAVSQNLGLTMQYRIRRPSDASQRWVAVWTVPDDGLDPASGRHCCVGTVQDITDRKRAEQELASYRTTLEEQMRLDPLTQVANRRALQEHLLSEWYRAMRQKTPLAVLVLGMDGFKAYNDNYGHLAGDACLQSVAHSIKQCVGRSGEMVARFGGEEFVVVLPDTDVVNAKAAAERIRAGVMALRIEHAFSAVADCVSISIGLTVAWPPTSAGLGGNVPDASVTVRELLKAADDALSQAKQQGRNRVVVSETAVAGLDSPP